MEFQKVKAVQDEDGHWFVIPLELSKEFSQDLYDYEFVESGKFDTKYGSYRTDCRNG